MPYYTRAFKEISCIISQKKKKKKKFRVIILQNLDNLFAIPLWQLIGL